MPHPVPPSEPYPIVQPLAPEAIIPASTTVPVSATQFAIVKALFTPTPSETFSQSSPRLNATKSAALLGPSVGVGYPVKPVETISLSDGSSTNPPATLQSLAQLLQDDTLTLQEKHNSDTSESPNSQTVKFNFPAPIVKPQLATQQTSAQRFALILALGGTAKQKSQPSKQSTPPSTPPIRERIIELTSLRQEYDQKRQIVTAEGNVLLRFDGAVVTANRLQVNLPNLIAVGEGNVVLTRGQQVIRGERFTYNFIQDSGELLKARGDVYLPTTNSDFSGTLPTDVSAGVVPTLPPSDRLPFDQPLQQVTSPGSIGINVGGRRNAAPAQKPSNLRRVRFQAEQINFYPGGWQARNARTTNDPFSPPELELRADTATLTRQTPLLSQLVTTRPRLVFDQGPTLPIPRNEATIGRRQREVNPSPVQVGYDATDKGGLFIERSFKLINTEQLNLSVAPQFFVERAFNNSSNVSGLFGLRTRLDSNLGPRTEVRGIAVFNGFDSNALENRLRASLRLRQIIGTRVPHTLNLEYSYRDRLYNGSLGFQTVQSSVGAILTSPVIPLGKSGFNLSYQVGAQYVNADTDRSNLLAPITVRKNNRVSLSRFQGSAALNRGYLIWHGQGLPSTPTQGLKYTPQPVVPNLVAYGGLTGVAGYYSSSSSQDSLTATVGLTGQFGHFSRPYLDYTAFNLSYSQGIVTGQSPFLFDRFVDTKILSIGFTQQIYGPIRFGLQTSLNLDTGRQINADYVLEYSRRTYGISLRYNPNLRLGSISLRISDFNWAGGTTSFSGPEFQPVVNGVPRFSD